MLEIKGFKACKCWIQWGIQSETIKEYSDKLFHIANKVGLLDTKLFDSSIEEIFLLIVPKIYEAPIASLENKKDLSKITLA